MNYNSIDHDPFDADKRFASSDSIRRSGSDHHQESRSSLRERPSSSAINENEPLINPYSTTSDDRNILADYSLSSKFEINSEGRETENMLKLKDDKKVESSQDETNEVDGRRAFFTLAVIFMINANSLASLKVYGIIFERIVADKYYTREEASWPVSTASTVQNLAGLLTPILALRLSWRSIELIQATLLVFANVGAYYSNNLAQDIICLGIIQGVAFSIRYNMNVVINNEYFHKYRATAMGISLAGSSCGVFFLKPYIAHVLDSSEPNKFRNAYLALAMIMCLNLILAIFIRKPKSKQVQNAIVVPDQSVNGNEQDNSTTNNNNNINESDRLDESEALNIQEGNELVQVIIGLLKNPSIHCIWIMQTIYFYISRTYTIFIVDYGVDQGFSRERSRNLLTSWVLGEVGGRFFLGGFVDYKLLNLKWNIVIVNLLLALSGFALLINPSVFNEIVSTNVNVNSPKNPVNQTIINNLNSTITGQQSLLKPSSTNNAYYWSMNVAIAMIAALSSLINIMIVPFSQEYLGKKNVPWAFALGSIVSGLFLLMRPVLIGLSKDSRNSYDLLIIVMSSAPCIYGFLFLITEPILRMHRYTRVSIDEPIND